MMRVEYIGGEYVKSAREMMSEKVREGHGPDGRAFVVTDGQGQVVLDFPCNLAISD